MIILKILTYLVQVLAEAASMNIYKITFQFRQEAVWRLISQRKMKYFDVINKNKTNKIPLVFKCKKDVIKQTKVKNNMIGCEFKGLIGQ